MSSSISYFSPPSFSFYLPLFFYYSSLPSLFLFLPSSIFLFFPCNFSFTVLSLLIFHLFPSSSPLSFYSLISPLTHFLLFLSLVFIISSSFSRITPLSLSLFIVIAYLSSLLFLVSLSEMNCCCLEVCVCAHTCMHMSTCHL